jgi:hypothetical protein
MTMLRDLLATWENWSARDTLTRALHTAATEHDRDVLRRGLHTCPEVDPLDVLRAGSELVALLRGWQWQAVYAARRDGSSWEHIATALDVTAEQARADYLAAVVQQERHGISDVTAYREVL